MNINLNPLEQHEQEMTHEEAAASCLVTLVFSAILFLAAALLCIIF
jgi:hypothetical protein